MRLKDRDRYRAKVDIHGPAIVAKGTEMTGAQWKVVLKHHENLEKNLAGLLKNVSLEKEKSSKKIPLASLDDRTRSWIKRARKEKAAYIISVCDTFSYGDYPVFVGVTENLEKRKKEYDGVNMQRINEVIDLSKIQL
jgi:hypothetical protein